MNRRPGSLLVRMRATCFDDDGSLMSPMSCTSLDVPKHKGMEIMLTLHMLTRTVLAAQNYILFQFTHAMWVGTWRIFLVKHVG